MKRREREVRLNYAKGKRGYVSVMREQYLRTDIPCKVKECTICDIDSKRSDWKGPLLGSALHYAIPDVQALSDYLEVFEQPGLTGCILLQTALSHIRTKVGRQSYRRVKALLSSPLKDTVMFSNENHLETFSPREGEESRQEWQQRLVYTAGVWYTNHLKLSNIQTPVVIVTTDPASYFRFEPERTEGLFVLALEDYLPTFRPSLTDVQTLFESVRDSLQSSKEPVDTASISHWSAEKIREGLKKGVLYSGRLRVGQYHPRDEAYVTPQVAIGDGGRTTPASEILIAGETSRNRAIHNDVVAVRLLPRSQWRSRNNALPLTDEQKAEGGSEGEVEGDGRVLPTGEVVGIVERADRQYVATFDESCDLQVAGRRSEKVLVYPYDHRIPKVRISTRQAQELKNHRFVIHIDSWEPNSRYPNGHFVRSIGPIGNIETETEVILIEHELSAETFSKTLLKELNCAIAASTELSLSEDREEWRDGGVWEVDEREITEKGRRDLRHTHLIMSIDPRGCEDVDDALSVRSLDNGDVELGVHIADVSHFVTPGSLTDLEARQRSTTVYMADRRYDMLPSLLSADLCSLLSNVDRYAVSVIWTLDGSRSYHTKGVWFGRTVIRSCYKLAYEVAQEIYDGKTSAKKLVAEIPELQSVPSLSAADKEEKIAELRNAIKSLVEIAHVLRERRGGLELEGVEVRVQIDDKDKTNVEDLIPKQPLEMHEIIAECMIFANSEVARKVQNTYPTKALLRLHPAPSQERFAQMIACAEIKGFAMETQSNKQLARSLDEAVDPSDPDFNRILRYLATQAMVQAQYFSTGSLPPEQYNHYGLDLDLYTHFTSPIRRYADLVVHRQLLAAVGDPSTNPDLLPSNERLHEMAQHMNKKRRDAQLAQNDSVELFRGFYFKTKDLSFPVAASSEGISESSTAGSDRHEIDAVVIGIRSNGLLVLSLKLGIRGQVYLKDKYGLVAQPSSDSVQQEVVFDTGTLSRTEHSVTVQYPRGEYTFHVLDHVRVHVSSMPSHAHGMSLSLRLLRCGPAPLDPSAQGEGEKRMANKEMIKTIYDEAEQLKSLSEQSSGPVDLDEYRQSDSSKSLYCCVQKLQRLALQPLNT